MYKPHSPNVKLNNQRLHQRKAAGCLVLSETTHRHTHTNTCTNIEEWCRYNFAARRSHTKKLCSRLFSTAVEFYLQKQQNCILCHPFGDLGVTYTVHLWLVGKRVVDFLLVLIELFSQALTVEALWADIGWNCGFWKGDGSCWLQISGEIGSSTNDFWRQKTIMRRCLHDPMFSCFDTIL